MPTYSDTVQALDIYTSVAATQGQPRYTPVKFGDGIWVEEGTANLVTAPQPDGSGTWSAFGTKSNVPIAGGGAVAGGIFRVTRLAGDADGRFTVVTLGTVGVLPVGTVYTSSLYVRPSADTTLGLLVVRDDTFATITGGTGSTAVCKAGQWTRLTVTWTSLTLPSPQNRFLLAVTTTTSVGIGYYIDASNAQNEPRSTATSYADGSMGVGYAWDSSNNILSAEDASFEGGTTGTWNVSTSGTAAASRANDGTASTDGTKSLKLTETAGGGFAQVVSANTYTSTVGTPYTVSVSLKASSTRAVLFGINWYNVSGTFLSTSSLSPTLPSATWVRVAATATAPANAVRFAVVVQDATAANGQTINIDAVQVEQRGYATSYGATGTANATSTTRTPIAPQWAAPASLTTSVTKLSLVAWVRPSRPNTATSNAPVIRLHTASGSAGVIFLSSTGVDFNSYIDAGVHTNATWAADDILFVAATYDETQTNPTWKIYASVNGGAVTSATAASPTGNTPIGPAVSVIMGFDFTNVFDGGIEQALVCNDVLSAADVTALATSTAASDYTSDKRIVFAAATPTQQDVLTAWLPSSTLGFYRTATTFSGRFRSSASALDAPLGTNLPINQILLIGNGTDHYKVTAATVVLNPDGTPAYETYALTNTDAVGSLKEYQFSLHGQNMGAGGALPTGSKISITEITGLDLPDPNSTVSPRSANHGSYVTARYHKERVITISGRINSTPANYALDTYALKAVFDTDTTGATTPFGIQLPGLPQQYVNVYTAGVRYSMRNVETSVGWVDFIATLIGGDPRIYSSATNTTGVHVTGTWSQTNAGTVNAPTIIRFDGPITNPQIANNTTGKIFKLVTTIASGHYVLINTLDRTVLLDGTTSTYSTVDSTNASWVEFAPGVNSLTYSNTSGAGTCTITWQDTWL